MQPGETLVMRYAEGARPVRVIGKRNGYLATWLPAGTMCAAPVMADGASLRSVPLRERFTGQRKSQLKPWEGHGILILIPDDGAHSIWLFWHDDGSFWGWYVNLEERHAWDGNVIWTRDHVLDISCERPRDWEWKDEDELAAAVEFGAVTNEQAHEIRREGERVAGMIERWEPPFSDGWEAWKPDPEWPLPVLPEDWAA